MNSFQDQTVLILAPHPDDEIFGCGGLIHRVKQDGGKVYVLYLTVGTTQDFSKNGQSTLDERMEEVEKVVDFLDIDGYKIAFPGNDYHLKLDSLPQKTLIDEIERGEDISLEVLKPTTVVSPFPNDYNQDHRASCLAMVTATRPTVSTYKSFQTMVLNYELPSTASWTDRNCSSSMNYFLELSEENLKAKTDALALYNSQLKHDEAPLSVHGAKTLASLRGLQTGTKYAEAYYVKRLFV